MSTILLRPPIILKSPSQGLSRTAFENCSLRWEKDALTISLAIGDALGVPALKNEAWLRECLDHSPVKAVYLDHRLDKKVMESWATVCENSGKRVYIESMSIDAIGRQHSQPIHWQSFISRAVAICLFTILSPLIVVAALAIKLESKGPVIIRQWQVSRDGQLVRVYKFRSLLTNSTQTTRLGYWLCRSKLDRLPKLINLIKGEICSRSFETITLQDFSYQ